MVHFTANRYFCASIWRPFLALFTVMLLIAELGAFGVEVIGAPVVPSGDHMGWVLVAILPPLMVEVLPIAAIVAAGWLANSWYRKGVVLGFTCSSVRAWDLAPALLLFGCLVGATTGVVTNLGVDWSQSTLQKVAANSASLAGGGAVSFDGLDVISIEPSEGDGDGALFAFGTTVVAAEAAVVDVMNQQVTTGAGQAHLLNNANSSVFVTFERARTPLFHAPVDRESEYARAIQLKRYSWPVAVVMLIVITGVWSLSGARWAGGLAWLSYWGLVRVSDHMSGWIGAEWSAWGPSIILFLAILASWRKRELT